MPKIVMTTTGLARRASLMGAEIARKTAGDGTIHGVDPAFLYPGAAALSVLEPARALSGGSFDPATQTPRQSIHTWLVKVGIYTDIVAPVEAAALAFRITVDGQEVPPGLSYHSIPGHSINHAAIMLESAGQRALFWGDALHHPVQVARPDVNSVFCEFPDAARASRRRALDLAADSGATVFTTHFAESSAGRVRRDGDAYVGTSRRERSNDAATADEPSCRYLRRSACRPCLPETGHSAQGRVGPAVDRPLRRAQWRCPAHGCRSCLRPERNSQRRL